uniref:SFRICE_027881 n=1 Tax=Spodoptera frugiperda TaxID=7108 RepID=A0A2H1WRX3_SPOFR
MRVIVLPSGTPFYIVTPLILEGEGTGAHSGTKCHCRIYTHFSQFMSEVPCNRGLRSTTEKFSKGTPLRGGKIFQWLLPSWARREGVYFWLKTNPFLLLLFESEPRWGPVGLMPDPELRTT